MLAALDHGRREVVRASDDVGDNVCVRRIGNRRFQDPDDGRGAGLHHAPQLEHLSKHVGVGMQAGDPELVGEHHGARSLWAIVARVEQASELWL